MCVFNVEVVEQADSKVLPWHGERQAPADRTASSVKQKVHFSIRLMRKAMNYGPLSIDPDWFNDDENFALVMQQTLYLQRGINVKLKRLKEDNPFLSMRGWMIRSPPRILLLAGWVLNHAHRVVGHPVGRARSPSPHGHHQHSAIGIP